MRFPAKSFYVLLSKIPDVFSLSVILVLLDTKTLDVFPCNILEFLDIKIFNVLPSHVLEFLDIKAFDVFSRPILGVLEIKIS